MQQYDIVIIGGGPAGLTAAIYALRGGAKVLLLEKLMVGGQAGRLNEIANFPSYAEINGFDLTQKMYEQGVKLGLAVKYAEVVSLKQQEAYYIIGTSAEEFNAAAVIIATGATHASLGIEQAYIGRGAHYCATCDGMFYKDKDVALVGSSKVALGEALYLSAIVKKLYFVYKGEEQKSKDFLAPLLAKPNVEIVYQSAAKSIEGKSKVESITVENKEGEKRVLKIDGLFVSIGTTALTGFVANTLANNNGRIIVDKGMETSLKGVFACGDCLDKKFMQIVTACAEGAIAADGALSYINKV